MRGQETVINPVTEMLLLLFLGLICFIIAASIIPAQGSFSSKTYILEKCKDWKDEGCSQESADTIEITVDKKTKNLHELCVNEYGASKWYNGCYNLCANCTS